MRRFFIGMRTKCSSPFVQEHSGRDASLGRYKSFPQGAVDAALSSGREDNEPRVMCNADLGCDKKVAHGAL